MPFDNRHTDQPDAFSLHVGEKLREHQLPVDADVWRSLEKRLAHRPRPIVRLWPWAAAAAALIGALLWLNPFLTDDAQHETVARQQQPQTEIPAKEIAPQQPETPLLAQQTSPREKTIIRKTEKSDTETPLPQPTTDYEPTPEPQPTTTTEAEPKIHRPEIGSSEAQQPAKKPKTRAKPSLIARVGSGGGGLNLGFPSQADMDSSPIYNGGGEWGTDLNSGENQYKSLAPADYSEITHSPPVSASVMAEFPLDSVWSIETGLMYTYLATKFRKPDGAITYRGSLGLHYIGIPLNVKATLFQNNAWRVYAGAGATVEKGVSSVYRQQIFYNNGAVHNLNTRSSIGGLQFSGHLAAGFDYKIGQNIRLFGEPHIIYYFNNNQPMSVRTENPFTFGLNMGVRIQFK